MKEKTTDEPLKSGSPNSDRLEVQKGRKEGSHSPQDTKKDKSEDNDTVYCTVCENERGLETSYI
jgi:hypothetical protein